MGTWRLQPAGKPSTSEERGSWMGEGEGWVGGVKSNHENNVYLNKTEVTKHTGGVGVRHRGHLALHIRWTLNYRIPISNYSDLLKHLLSLNLITHPNITKTNPLKNLYCFNETSVFVPSFPPWIDEIFQSGRSFRRLRSYCERWTSLALMSAYFHLLFQSCYQTACYIWSLFKSHKIDDIVKYLKMTENVSKPNLKKLAHIKSN